ncbi:unnamed protein product, partial [Allacma fusca]
WISFIPKIVSTEISKFGFFYRTDALAPPHKTSSLITT